jgi:hypothetical protein
MPSPNPRQAVTRFPDDATLDAVRAQYFRDHGLGPDGGYSARWVKFRIGPLVIPFPNSAARVAALPLHDLHHIATEYDTSWTGEAEIAAWELGAGCGRYVAAWLLNLMALGIGLFIAPRRTWGAFHRGRYTRTLYNDPWDPAWLNRTVGTLRDRLALSQAPRPARASDCLLFASYALPGLGAFLMAGLLIRAVLRSVLA